MSLKLIIWMICCKEIIGRFLNRIVSYPWLYSIFLLGSVKWIFILVWIRESLISTNDCLDMINYLWFATNSLLVYSSSLSHWSDSCWSSLFTC
jgi:hypothetical protein